MDETVTISKAEYEKLLRQRAFYKQQFERLTDEHWKYRERHTSGVLNSNFPESPVMPSWLRPSAKG